MPSLTLARHWARKWYLIFLLSMRAGSMYRLTILSSLFAQIIRLFGALIIWYATIRSGSSLFTFSEIFTYYVIGELFMLNTTPHWSIASDVARGLFSGRRLKPMNTWFYYWVEDIGVDFFTHLFNIVLLASLAIIGWKYLLLPESAGSFVLFLLAALLGYLISLSLNYILGMMAFYTINIRGVSELFGQVQSLLSGRLFPLNLLPALGFMSYLPFAFTFYFPMQLYLGRVGEGKVWLFLTLGIAWLAVILLILKYVHRKAMSRYQAVNL